MNLNRDEASFHIRGDSCLTVSSFSQLLFVIQVQVVQYRSKSSEDVDHTVSAPHLVRQTRTMAFETGKILQAQS